MPTIVVHVKASNFNLEIGTFQSDRSKQKRIPVGLASFLFAGEGGKLHSTLKMNGDSRLVPLPRLGRALRP